MQQRTLQRKVIPQKKPVTLPVSLSNQSAEDMLMRKFASQGKSIKPMDTKVMFDRRRLTFDAAGAVRGPLVFFGNASSGHPLGNFATNMGRDGCVDNNKSWLIKNIGVSYTVVGGYGALTPAQIQAIFAQAFKALALWNLYTTDPGDRQLDRGCVCHFPGAVKLDYAGPLILNPAAVAAFIALLEEGNQGFDDLQKQKLLINWVLDEGSQFSVKIDGDPIVLGATYAAITIDVLVDMLVTEFTVVN